jgi:hypothetical protein
VVDEYFQGVNKMFRPIPYKVCDLKLEHYEIKIQFNGKGEIVYLNVIKAPANDVASNCLNDSTDFYWFVDKVYYWTDNNFLVIGTREFKNKEISFKNGYDMICVDVCDPTPRDLYCDTGKEKNDICERTTEPKCFSF